MSTCWLFPLLVCCALVADSAVAVRPPGYLGICQWKECVGEKDMGSHRIVCLPAQRPDNCPEASWQQLTALNELLPC